MCRLGHSGALFEQRAGMSRTTPREVWPFAQMEGCLLGFGRHGGSYTSGVAGSLVRFFGEIPAEGRLLR